MHSQRCIVYVQYMQRHQEWVGIIKEKNRGWLWFLLHVYWLSLVSLVGNLRRITKLHSTLRRNNQSSNNKALSAGISFFLIILIFIFISPTYFFFFFFFLLFLNLFSQQNQLLKIGIFLLIIPGRTPARVSGSFNTEKRQQKIGITQQQQNNNNPNEGSASDCEVLWWGWKILYVRGIFYWNIVRRHNPFASKDTSAFSSRFRSFHTEN